MASPTGFLARFAQRFAGAPDPPPSAGDVPDFGIGRLPVELLESVVAFALSSEPLGVFAASPADSTAYAQMRTAIRIRKATASRLVLVGRVWQALVRRQMSRLVHYRPLSVREGEIDLAEALDEDGERATRIVELVVDLEDVPRQSILGTHSMGSSQPLLDMQRSSAEVCLCCPLLAHISVFRRTTRQRIYHALDPSASPAALDQNLVDAIVTRPCLAALSLHPASSYLDLQAILACPPTLQSLSLTLSHDLRAQPAAWSTSPSAVLPSASYQLRRLTLIFLADGCIRSSDLLRLVVGDTPSSLDTLELRFDPPREDTHHLFAEWARLLDMLLSRCPNIVDLTIADIGVMPSMRLASTLGQCQDGIHALAKLERLTLSRVFFPDVFVLTCDTLLSQVDLPTSIDHQASPPRSLWSDSHSSTRLTDDLFGLLDADGGRGEALMATMERIGQVPKLLRVDDATSWTAQQRRIIQDRCWRLGIALVASWSVAGGSPRARSRSLSA